MEIIAEIGQNFNGDMELAHELIKSAKDNGAEVAKFQLYDAKKLFPSKGNLWFEYNCKTELTRNNVEKLNKICDDNDMEFMASAFDVERVAWLEDIGVKRYKLASRSIVDEELIHALSETGKPLIVSLGMWEENMFPKIPSENVQFLYCISKYPTLLEDIKLGEVDFTKYAGFSDHSIGISAAMAAFSRGAVIVEKHFTLDKSSYGPDHKGSMNPDELHGLVKFRDELKRCL